MQDKVEELTNAERVRQNDWEAVADGWYNDLGDLCENLMEIDEGLSKKAILVEINHLARQYDPR